MKLANLLNKAELISVGVARRTPMEKQAMGSVSNSWHRSTPFSSLRSVFTTT
ncbi:hypothetical protein [Nostoc sp.]|uniref:hypothetical protein n=1 Tax=Nostoc sp. TaxID=1180 RepID=UPI002FFB30C6